MKSLFDNLSSEVSKITTRTYSTSFSMGIYFLNNRLRDDIYSIYGFVRVADEIVDSFHGFDKARLLAEFRADTWYAIESKISTNPILNSFQQTVYRYKIRHDLIETFFESMKMDLDMTQYSDDKYKEYILGSAEVVGLMCLHVFTEGNMPMFYELRPYAMRLGAAFQKVNFLRDLQADYNGLGRTYFPGINPENLSTDQKLSIEQEIEEDFRYALKGIRRLPSTSKGGVYLAFVYYRSLFNKIKRTPVQRILKERIRINSSQKMALMINSMLQHKLNWI
jgi:phytoene/squalene synthetase